MSAPTIPADRSHADEAPLVVDVDGTLIRSDISIESLFRLLADDPLAALRTPFWYIAGRAVLKDRIAARVEIDIERLPLNTELVEHLRAEKAGGRRLYLASASDRRYVERLAERLGLFDGVFASDGVVNLSGSAKAERLVAAFGEHGFDYAGDNRADLAVWAKARDVLAVDCAPSLLRAVRSRHPDATVIGERRIPLGQVVRAVRVHQWLKNLLVFLPLLTAHLFTGEALASALLAFVAFSLTASGVYLLNDLVDLASDRDHATKRFRPLASGSLPLGYGMALVPLLFLAGGALALLLPLGFLGVLALYLAVTMAYSLYLKRKALLDVLTLAGLYTLRIFAGAVAIGITVSNWLLAFSLFIFLALAIVKRYTELKARLDADRDDPSGRGYRLSDLPILGALGGASGFSAVLVFALYIQSPYVRELYAHPDLLWLISPILVYWLSRVLLKAHRGEMHDDPIVFALKDGVSLAAGAAIVLIVLAGAAW